MGIVGGMGRAHAVAMGVLAAAGCRAAPAAEPRYVTYGAPIQNRSTTAAPADGQVGVCDAIALALADLDAGLADLASDTPADPDAVDSAVEEYDIRRARFTVDGAYASVQLGGIPDMSLTYVDQPELVDALRDEVAACPVLHDDTDGAWEVEDDAPNLTYRRPARGDVVWVRPFSNNALVLVMRQ